MLKLWQLALKKLQHLLQKQQHNSLSFDKNKSRVVV
jgi:hypothetical protein